MKGDAGETKVRLFTSRSGASRQLLLSGRRASPPRVAPGRLVRAPRGGASPHFQSALGATAGGTRQGRCGLAPCGCRALTNGSFSFSAGRLNRDARIATVTCRRLRRPGVPSPASRDVCSPNTAVSPAGLSAACGGPEDPLLIQDTPKRPRTALWFDSEVHHWLESLEIARRRFTLHSNLIFVVALTKVLELAFYRSRSELADTPCSHRRGTARGSQMREPASASGAGVGISVRAIAGRWLPPPGAWTFPKVTGVGSRCVSVLCAHTSCELRSECCSPRPLCRAHQSSLTAGDCPRKDLLLALSSPVPRSPAERLFLGSGDSRRRSCCGNGPGQWFSTWTAHLPRPENASATGPQEMQTPVSWPRADRPLHLPGQR